ncbi:MAG: hypothetical protein E7425_10785 [Ruminococcaceae bacterium]|nr:hypothetical protein [Oscillospiraceae bacterium]
MNNKRSSKNLASTAAKILNNDNASKIQRSLAGGVLSQRNPNKQTGADMESKASKVLSSEKYSDTTKSLAASLVSQSNRER